VVASPFVYFFVTVSPFHHLKAMPAGITPKGVAIEEACENLGQTPSGDALHGVGFALGTMGKLHQDASARMSAKFPPR
jgi:hypothetical protein